jgi:transmembrane sensor
MESHKAEAEDLLCDESFLRYCRGEDKAAIQYWEAWISAHPEKQPIVHAAKRMYDWLSLGQGNRLEQLAALKDAIERRSQLKEVIANTPVVRLQSRRWLAYAASIILLISIGAIAYIKYEKPSNTHEYFTGVNDRKTIVLPDSTIIMLNQNSHLVVNQYRQVSITGEAFFNVKHNARHPFLVNTRQYTIRVLGTTFNVRSYPGKDTTETTLLTGQIEIIKNTNEPKIVLKPNQKFVLATNTNVPAPSNQLKGAVVTPVIDTATRHLVETSWTRKQITIKDQSLSEIATQLQAWYGIRIRFADDSVQHIRYTATFDDETIFNALVYLQQSYPFTYTIEDDCIVIAKAE